MRKNLPNKEFFINKQIPGINDYKIIDYIDSGMNAHMFKAFNEVANNYAACKIIPKSNLKITENQPRQWLNEVVNANRLDSNTVVQIWGTSEWIDEENNIDCVILCADYVKGINLEKYINKTINDISISFIEEFLSTMFDFFNEMLNKNVRHGDLHPGNILVEDKSNSLKSPKYQFRVTDFAVASETSNMILLDDFHQLAKLLKLLLENVNYQECRPRDKYAFNILNDHFLNRHLIENDSTRDPLARNPLELYNKLGQIDEDFHVFQSENSPVKLNSPFDYPSLEQFGDSHQLLNALYSELFLGLIKIEQKSNLVLTGPRGCGKSTSYKSLSLQHKISVGNDKPEQIGYIGIYYRCDDLYFAFPRYKIPKREEANDLPIHFIIATLIIEILESVERWSKKYFKDQFVKYELKVSAEIWKILNLEKPNIPSSDSFSAIIDRMNKERKRSTEKQRFVHDSKHKIGYYFGPDILIRACEKIIMMIPYLHNFPFFFFIDDYSSPKITEDLQRNLNRLFMQRTASCFFKLATESPVSYVRDDIDGKNYVEGREFDLLNLGFEYIHAESGIKLKFIEDIFKKRFEAVDDYPIKNIENLLGNVSLESYNQQALKIRDKKKVFIGGKKVLCDLCSGDIHYIINLVGNMVQAINSKDGLLIKDNCPIDLRIQYKSIRDEAGNFLKNLQRLHKGSKLVEIVTAFGKVAHSYLLYRDSKNENSHPPHQSTRIEPYEQLNLSPEANEIYKELLRYSVFIEDLRGKSRRGEVVPRLYLRRFLIPHFNLTFNMRDSIEVEPEEIELLLMDPKQFEKRKRLKSSNDKEKEDNESGKLFT